MPIDDLSSLDWSYVAGFTDGEGHLRKTVLANGVSRFSVYIYQSTKNAAVLEHLRCFLADEGIEATIYLRTDTRRDERHPSTGAALVVRKVRSVYDFLSGIQPYSIVKADIVQELLMEIEQKKQTSRHKVYEGW